jgi:hypothetical protein
MFVLELNPEFPSAPNSNNCPLFALSTIRFPIFPKLNIDTTQVTSIMDD